MKNYTNVDDYILSADKHRELLMVIRDVICTTQLVETMKWGVPVYTINGKMLLE